MWAKYSTEAKYIATWHWRQRIRQTRWDLYSNAMYRASWRQWMRAKYSIDAKYRANWCWRKRLRQTMRHMMPQKRADSSFWATERRKQQQSRHLKRVSDPAAAFSQHIQEDPVHTCVSCHRHLYKQSVVKFIETSYKPASQEILATMLATKTTSCTCQRYIIQGQVPPQAAVNGLLLDDTPKLLRLTELESMLIAQCVPFMRVLALPHGQQVTHGADVNVPSCVSLTVTCLPLTARQTGIIPLKLKWRLRYKGNVMHQFIRPQAVLNAVNWLIRNNQLYWARMWKLTGTSCALMKAM